ncbi:MULTISPECIES: hypothetical protein [Sphingobacterium]|uniref:hypothetical protein n=1 Tax=Sphingobacterium TaxID=28453 RepID=UPI0013DA23AD|nr:MULTISPECIES: hypothetical protein [unclassified Sphingobacterium]
MKLPILILCLLFLSQFHCSGQSADYYINMNMDTVYGEFRSISNGKIKFKVNDKKTTLDPKQVYRVYDADKSDLYGPSYIQNCIVRIEDSKPKMYKISERLRETEKPLFAQIHEDGEIIVYSFSLHRNSGPSFGSNGMMTPGASSRSDRYYALKKSTNEILELRKTGTVVFFQVSGTKINRNLSDYLDNSPELIAEIENEPKLKYEFILERIKRYNAKKELIGEGKSKYGRSIF